MRLGLDAGAATGTGLDEVYARAMPAPPARIVPGDFVRLRRTRRPRRAARLGRGVPRVGAALVVAATVLTRTAVGAAGA